MASHTSNDIICTWDIQIYWGNGHNFRCTSVTLILIFWIGPWHGTLNPKVRSQQIAVLEFGASLVLDPTVNPSYAKIKSELQNHVGLNFYSIDFPFNSLVPHDHKWKGSSWKLKAIHVLCNNLEPLYSFVCFHWNRLDQVVNSPNGT